MQPELEKLGIGVVALSKDSAEDAATHKARDGLSLTLLADPELQVIRQYGVEHHKALNYTTGTFMIGGIPLALVPSFKTMAIPTTLLVDERGVIQWIDQSDDYRVRSDDSRVRAAVLRAFG
jgi:alkyl hydroperoxide reductase subunit AhpC